MDHPHQEQILQQLDIFPENGEIIMSRKIMSSGRSICRINSETVSAALMRKVASLLIDIHGQHEHQSLLTRKNHMKYLDAYAKKELAPEKEKLSDLYQHYISCKKRLEEASLDAEQRARELSFLQYEIAEIEEADLQPGEDEQLETDYRRLSHGRRIVEAAAECRELCSEGISSASDNIGRAVRALLAVSDYDEQMSGLSEQLQEVDNLMNDFNRDLADYLAELDFSDETFAAVEMRLDTVNRLKSKYGKTIELILEEKTSKESQVKKLLHYDEYRRQLEADLQQAEDSLKEISGKVSEIRQKYAKKSCGRNEKCPVRFKLSGCAV